MRIQPTLTTVERALFLLEVETFKLVSSEELAAIAARMVEMRFEPGQDIYRGADPEGRIFIVVEGAAEQLEQDVVVRRLTRSMGFGLFGLLGLSDEETVRAVEPMHLLCLSREDFIDALSDSPAFALGMIRGLARTMLVLLRRIEDLEGGASGVGAQAIARDGPVVPGRS
jgi:CRP-like cAMP-binding protein